jgi:hypothetical protein
MTTVVQHKCKQSSRLKQGGGYVYFVQLFLFVHTDRDTNAVQAEGYVSL